MVMHLKKHSKLVPENFVATVPAHPATGTSSYPNPQLQSLMKLMEIYVAPPSEHTPANTITDPNAISLDENDEDPGRNPSVIQVLGGAAKVDPNEINLDL